ncbi:MAG: WbqC family protein [Bacteroidota bacterium]
MISLSTCYMPPAAYFAGGTDRFFSINTHERFIKQNLRTRCHILSPNGIITLVVPVAHQELNNSLVKDVRISHKENWQRRHFRTIKTCYGRSPYFEFFEEELAKFYDLRLEFLWEFNLASVRFLSDSMGLSAHFNVVDKENMEIPYAYLSNYSSPDQLIQQPSYMQVFRDRFPFVSGLSALDLLMNLGPASVGYLNSMGVPTQPKK